jgi:alpha/beta superfamily hydrolase
LGDAVREIAGPAGPLEVLIDLPASANASASAPGATADKTAGKPRAAVVFAHPLPTHGGTMHTKVVFQGAKALTRIGCAVLRFNFRGVGHSAGTWDEGRGEQDDYRAALDYFSGQYPETELWAAGFSFGSHIAMTCGAADDRVCALIGIAPPVDRYDYGLVKQSTKAKFLIHGERDELIPLRAVREFYAQLQEPKEFIEIDRANHLFDGQASEVGDALEELLEGFTCRTQ